MTPSWIQIVIMLCGLAQAWSAVSGDWSSLPHKLFKLLHSTNVEMAKSVVQVAPTLNLEFSLCCMGVFSLLWMVVLLIKAPKNSITVPDKVLCAVIACVFVVVFLPPFQGEMSFMDAVRWCMTEFLREPDAQTWVLICSFFLCKHLLFHAFMGKKWSWCAYAISNYCDIYVRSCIKTFILVLWARIKSDRVFALDQFWTKPDETCALHEPLYPALPVMILLLGMPLMTTKSIIKIFFSILGSYIAMIGEMAESWHIAVLLVLMAAHVIYIDLSHFARVRLNQRALQCKKWRTIVENAGFLSEIEATSHRAWPCTFFVPPFFDAYEGMFRCQTSGTAAETGLAVVLENVRKRTWSCEEEFSRMCNTHFTQPLQFMLLAECCCYLFKSVRLYTSDKARNMEQLFYVAYAPILLLAVMGLDPWLELNRLMLQADAEIVVECPAPGGFWKNS